MGHVLLMRLMAMQRERRRRQTLATDESVEKRKGSSYQQDDNPRSGKRMRYSVPYLPEEIWQHVHSFMPMRDAARAACLSSSFLHSWRSHPKLTFSIETLGLVEGTTDFIRKIDRVMKKHSGIGVKALTIEFNGLFSTKARSYLERWLQIAVTPRIEELSLVMFSSKGNAYYDFPCSLLSDGNGSSIRLLDLYCCTFRPTAELGCFQSLRRLHLKYVRITGDELGRLLSASFALERLELSCCQQIKHVKVPSMLQQLSYMEVHGCLRLQVIEDKAPNLHSLHLLDGGNPIQLSFGESSLVKKGWDVSLLSIMELPSIFPNLETLTIRSFCEVSSKYPKDDSIFVNPPDLRRLPEQRHDNLQDVKIIGFHSAKSLIELTYHILENTSVECLSLDTISGTFRCSPGETGGGRCFHMEKDDLVEASKHSSLSERI